MKKLLLLLTTAFIGLVSFAAHITGGEMYYILISQNGNSYTYRVTLKLYRDCFSSGADLDPSAAISVFDNSNNAQVWTSQVVLNRREQQNLSSPSPCIQNPPPVCYDVGYYEATITLNGSAAGYTIAYQRCCRISGINNIIGSSAAGSTYTAIVPGTSALASAPANNSAQFNGIDTVITCANNTFCYNFGAIDPDGDSLSYAFDYAFLGGSQNNPAPVPPAAPPYGTVTYFGEFSVNAPLGRSVTLDPATGMLCGIAPAPGIYVVTVAVTEHRNGAIIATQRKDLQIKVGDCNVADAALKPEYITCDGFSYTFANEAPPNPLITSYYWEFSDGFTSSDANPFHTFSDTGIYDFKLVINRGQECSDSVSSRIKVYPGFFPGFDHSGICVTKPTQFRDTTNTRYGFVNTWRWDFGDAGNADTSRAQNPSYTFNTPGLKDITFIVTNSKGCIDTVEKQIEIVVSPPLSVAFKDTLICTGDSMQLGAIGNGVFSWTPNANIIDGNTANPTVFPTTTTDYVVQLDDQGCLATDTVKVRVVDFVTLQAMPDTVICMTDSVQLRASTDGLRYSWDNAATLDDPNSLTPMALPVDEPTTYTITATIGHCVATDQVTVTLVPYPTANAGNDTVICYNTAAQLNGSIVGNSHTWSPGTSLANAGTLTPIARPRTTTMYVLSAFDTRGCPKPGKDTVFVVVNPEVIAFAGRDTSIVVGQVLQFNASGGESYQWSPAVALSNTAISNPTATYNGSFDSIRYNLVVSDSIGCTDDATVLVKVFRTNPRVFVPTAFTPNGDGRNEFVAPVAVGLTRLDYFRIYNRWGQLVFETTINGKGWDGRIAGKEQGSSTYVWVVQGTDYTGKTFFDKGTVTLIR